LYTLKPMNIVQHSASDAPLHSSKSEIALEESSASPKGIDGFRPRYASSALWCRIADFGVLGIWLATVISTLRYHEKWADEAQAWMLVRELDLKTLWFHELRYEGSPGLWHGSCGSRSGCSMQVTLRSVLSG